jgi:hypothetical protein
MEQPTTTSPKLPVENLSLLDKDFAISIRAWVDGTGGIKATGYLVPRGEPEVKHKFNYGNFGISCKVFLSYNQKKEIQTLAEKLIANQTASS